MRFYLFLKPEYVIFSCETGIQELVILPVFIFTKEFVLSVLNIIYLSVTFLPLHPESLMQTFLQIFKVYEGCIKPTPNVFTR